MWKNQGVEKHDITAITNRLKGGWDLGETYEPPERLACPKCRHPWIGERYTVGVGGTRTVECKDKPGWVTLEPGTPAAYHCPECDYEADSKEPFVEGHRELELHEEREREARRREVEDEYAPIAQRLVGRTITAAQFHAEGPPPGFDGSSPDIESATIHLDDGTALELNACGWHDIQSLGVSHGSSSPSAQETD